MAKRKPDENKVPYDISRNRPSTRTRMIPHIAAGVAIVLVLGVVVVNSGVFSPHSNSASSDAAYEAVEEEAVNTGTMEAASMEGAAEENAQADAEAVVVDWAAEYPVVELPDGTRLRLGEETTVSNLGWFEATTAYSEDGTASVKCRVRDNGDGTYIVTYDYRQFYEAVPE